MEMAKPTNADLIATVVEKTRSLGREVAAVEDIRQMLEMTSGASAAA